MNACVKAITTSKMLQVTLIIDSLSIILQAYFISNYEYLILASTLACFHIIVFILEHFFQGKNRLIVFILNVLKGAAQLIAHYQLEESWLIFAGIQITCLLKQDLQHINIVAIVLFLVQILSIAYTSKDFMVVGILRTIFNYFLITQIFRLERLNYFSFLENILKNISHEEFCLLDNNFKPIYQQQIFSKFEDEQVVGLNDFYNQTRVITPRDHTSQLIRGSGDDESKSTITIKEIISYLKKSNMFILAKKKLSYEINNSINSNIMIEKILFENLGHLIVMSKKKLFENQKQSDHVQTMINTVHKVSHDMRNPLNAIINMQMCLEDQIDPILSKKYLKPSLNSCHLLLNLINDILDAAQVENNKIKLIYRKFNLSKLITKTISIFDILKEKKELKISFNYDQKLPKKIFSDKLRIRQIIMNLLSNAIKYTQPKGSVLIECQHSEEKQNVIVVSIQDTGFGIKPENLKCLFKQFSKIDDQENQKVNPMGIGLGLMISNELAKLLSKNSCIQVHSEYGRGSKFFFEIENRCLPQEDLSESQISDTHQNVFPILETHFIQMLSQQKSPTISLQIPQVESSNKILLKKPKKQINLMTNSLTFQPNLKAKNDERSIFRKQSFQANLINNLIQKWNDNTNLLPPILVVDDDEVNIMVLYYLLEQIGFQSDSAMNGMDCLQKFQERQKNGTSYQLIFLDIHMPVMDGFETAKRLRQIDPIVMIIACSGDPTNENELEQYKQSGIMNIVQKPVGKAQLKDIFLKLCDGMKHESQQSYF